jgi:hypothetical protein
MRLLRLLAAGKSLVGVKESGGRYRPVPAKALPVFEPTPNPFRATATPQGGMAIDDSALKMTPEPLAEARAAHDEHSGAQDRAKCPPAPAEVASGCASASQNIKGTAQSSGGRARWFRWRPFGKPADTSSLPSVPRAIQGELSLDNVRPVRNDLGDSDFEVVPVKRAAGAGTRETKCIAAQSPNEPASETRPGGPRGSSLALNENPK